MLISVLNNIILNFINFLFTILRGGETSSNKNSFYRLVSKTFINYGEKRSYIWVIVV